MTTRRRDLKIRYFLLLGLFVAASIPRIANLYRNGRKLSFYQHEVVRLERENESLKQTIEKIKSSPFDVEKLLRDNFGLMKSDETLFRIHKQNVPR